MNSQNVTIVMLLVTAAILTAILIGTFAGTAQVARAETSVRAGDYAMATGLMPGANSRLLYVIDMNVQQLIAYRTNDKTGVVDLVDKVDLTRAFRDK